MYILKNQDIVLTSTWVVDQTITMNFSNCIQAITDRFSQLLVLSKQPFNQALVLINQQFKFVSMNSSQKFQAKITQDLTRVFTTLGHVINQESAFLCQITLFKDMLTNADILLDVNQRLKRTAPISSPIQQPTTIFEQSFSVKPVNSKLLTFAKRSITDIWTPYSVTSIGDTANKNFIAMNENFHAIQASELRLAHQQTQLAQNFHLMQTHEKQLARKELYIELRTFKSNAFLHNLDLILKTIQLDPH